MYFHVIVYIRIYIRMHSQVYPYNGHQHLNADEFLRKKKRIFTCLNMITCFKTVSVLTYTLR